MSEEKNYLKLSDIMKSVSASVNDLFPFAQWVEAEIVSINMNKISGHCYLEVMESDSNGREICKTKISIWKSNVSKIFEKFKNATNSDLKAGVKVLFKCKITFHPQYQLSLAVEDINPEFTLGGMEVKIKEIIARLEKDAILSNNKMLNNPTDFTKIAVIAPSEAAGLGDFKKDADILEKYSLCKFDYYPAIFQGKETEKSVTSAIIAALSKSDTYDALIVIRGGGAKTDLHFLNEYEIAKSICLASIPVFVGVGHERDKGLLDIVGHTSFDTPSKVIGYIFSIINENVNIINNNFNFITETGKNTVLKNKMNILDNFNIIYKNSQRIISIFKNEINVSNSIISNNSKSLIESNKEKLKNNFETSCLLAQQIIEQVKKDNIKNLISIKQDGSNIIEVYKKDIANLLQTIKTFSPEKLLDFGFAIVRKDKTLISSTSNLANDDILEIFFKDGSVKVKIIGDTK